MVYTYSALLLWQKAENYGSSLEKVTAQIWWRNFCLLLPELKFFVRYQVSASLMSGFLLPTEVGPFSTAEYNLILYLTPFEKVNFFLHTRSMLVICACLEHFLKWIFLGIGAMENVKNRGLFRLLCEFRVPSLYDVRRTIKFYLSRAGCP